MSVIQGPRSTPTPQVKTAQGPAQPGAATAPHATADIASGFNNTSTFAADPAVAGAANRALGAIQAEIPNLPAAVLQPLQDAAASQVKALLGRTPPLAGPALQSELNKVVADFNGKVNGALTQQHLGHERGLIVQSAQGVIDQKLTKIDSASADQLRQAAQAQLDGLVNATPPLSNTALQAATDKLARGFLGQVSDATARQHEVATLLALVSTPDARMDPTAFGHLRDAALSKVATLVQAQPPLSVAQFQQELGSIKQAVKQAVGALGASKLDAVSGAGTGVTAEQLRDAYMKIMTDAFNATPPLSAAELQQKITDTVNSFKSDLADLQAGKDVQLPTANPAGDVGEDTAAARQKVIDDELQAIRDTKTFDRMFTAPPEQVGIDKLDPVAAKRVQDKWIKNVQALADHQPPYTAAELKTACDAAHQQFKVALTFEKYSADNFIKKLIAQMEKNRQDMIDAMKG